MFMFSVGQNKTLPIRVHLSQWESPAHNNIDIRTCCVTCDNRFLIGWLQKQFLHHNWCNGCIKTTKWTLVFYPDAEVVHYLRLCWEYVPRTDGYTEVICLEKKPNIFEIFSYSLFIPFLLPHILYCGLQEGWSLFQLIAGLTHRDKQAHPSLRPQAVWTH